MVSKAIKCVIISKTFVFTINMLKRLSTKIIQLPIEAWMLLTRTQIATWNFFSSFTQLYEVFSRFSLTLDGYVACTYSRASIELSIIWSVKSCKA